MNKPTALVELLRDAFGSTPSLPKSCWIQWAFAENQWDFSPAIEIALDCGVHSDLVRRLREEHPIGRQHLLLHDYGMFNFFTEVEACAWARAVANLSDPKFVLAPGSPDLIADSSWIEAKTINKSAVARAYDERVVRPALEAGQIVMSQAVALEPPLPGLVAKFQADLEDGLRKWDRQGRTGSLTMFYDWINVDFGISKRSAERAVLEWAARQSRADGVRIVVAWNYKWQTPIFDSGSD